MSSLLRIAAVALDEEPQHHVVKRIGQVEDLNGLGIGDPDPVIGVHRFPRHGIAGDRMGGLKPRVLGEQPVELLPNLEKLLIMRTLGMFSCTFALLHDGLNRRMGACQIRHRGQAGQRSIDWTDLIGNVAREKVRLAVTPGQHLEAVVDAPVKMADGLIVLRSRHDRVLRRRAVIVPGMDEFRSIFDLNALRALQKYCVIKQRVAKTHKFQIDGRGMVASGNREIRSRQVRSATNRDRQISDQGKVRHLFNGHLGHVALPIRNNLRLLRRQPVLLPALQAPNPV